MPWIWVQRRVEALYPRWQAGGSEAGPEYRELRTGVSVQQPHHLHKLVKVKATRLRGVVMATGNGMLNLATERLIDAAPAG